MITLDPPCLFIDLLSHSCIFIHYTHMCAKSLQSCRLFVTLWTVVRQAPLSMGFSRQEYWRGLPFPPPGDLPSPGIQLCLLCLLQWQTGAIWEATYNEYKNQIDWHCKTERRRILRKKVKCLFFFFFDRQNYLCFFFFFLEVISSWWHCYKLPKDLVFNSIYNRFNI